MKRIAVLRCGKLPSFVNWEIPNLDELFAEDDLLVRGFQSHGFEAQPVVWNDPEVDWNKYDIALIRSTWDYIDEQEQFLRVMSSIDESSCRLFNPLAAVRWNIDKRYLFDLEKWGIPVIPTILASEAKPETIHRLSNGKTVREVVLKPIIGLGASDCRRVPIEQLEPVLTVLQDNQPQREYLVQPFIEDVVNEGEWSFIYFNRQLSHVLLKKPAQNDYRVQGIYGGTVQPAESLPADLEQANEVIAKIPFDILYARLDFVRVDGRLSVIEIELIEPIFYFSLVPASISRLVDAVQLGN